MTSKITSILFMSAILFTSAIVASTAIMQDADAYTSSGTYTRQTGSKTVCGEVLCSEYPGGRSAFEAAKTAGDLIDKKDDSRDLVASSGSDTLQTALDKILQKLENGERLSKSEVRRAQQAMQEQEAETISAERYGGSSGIVATGTASAGQDAFGRTASDTLTSVQDPGQGHEGHQLAILLPPSDKVYVGKMTFSASENVQFVALHGPLGVGEDKGQAIWSPDGETKYALTFIDNGQKSGGWFFAGNALALHSMHDTPFTATYSIAYAEVDPGEYPKGTVATGTVTSIQDPGIGHEQHSLALILPPRDIPYSGGVISYSASENIQLVSLMGPLDEDDIHGQATWTADGETHYALTLVDGGKMGVWNTFSGNALAFHSMNPDGFTVTYTLAGLH
jgi:hypothetical protein